MKKIGRPRLPCNEIKKRKLLYLTEADMTAIEKAAKHKGLSVSSFTRMIILDYLAHNNKPEK